MLSNDSSSVLAWSMNSSVALRRVSALGRSSHILALMQSNGSSPVVARELKRGIESVQTCP